MQNLIAAQLGVQRITGITIFNTREEQTYDPLPDLEDDRTFSVLRKTLGSFLESTSDEDILADD
ncbi:hypothetical protein ACE6H2_007284 [Prunus campanulata]